MIGRIREVLRRRGRSARELMWVMTGQAAGAIGSVVGVRLLTAVMPPSAYGELALGMTVAMLAHQVAVAPVSGASMRFFGAADERNEFPMFLRAVWRLFSRVAFLLFVAALVSATYFLIERQIAWSLLSLVAALFALISSGNSILDGMQNAARQRIVVAFHDGAAPWLRFMLAVAFVRLTAPSSVAAMSGYAVAAALVFASQSFFFKRKIATPDRTSPIAGDSERVGWWYARLFSYASPFAMWGLFTWAQLSSDRWALNLFGSTAEVGYYAVLYQIGFYPISILANMMAQLVLPVLFRRAGDATDRERMESVRRMNQALVAGSIVLTLVGTLVAALLHRFIFGLLVAPSYRIASPYLPLMVLSAGLFTTGQLASLWFFSGSDTHALLIPKVVTSVIGVILNYVGAFLFQIKGVVLAGLGFSLIYLAWMLIASSRRRQFATVPVVAAETSAGEFMA